MRKFASNEDDEGNKGSNKNIIIDGKDISKGSNTNVGSGDDEDELDKLEKEAEDGSK